MANFIVRNTFIGFGFAQRLICFLPFCMKETMRCHDKSPVINFHPSLRFQMTIKRDWTTASIPMLCVKTSYFVCYGFPLRQIGWMPCFQINIRSRQVNYKLKYVKVTFYLTSVSVPWWRIKRRNFLVFLILARSGFSTCTLMLPEILTDKVMSSPSWIVAGSLKFHGCNLTTSGSGDYIFPRNWKIALELKGITEVLDIDTKL